MNFGNGINRASKAVAVLLLLIGLYVATFSYWWISGKRTVVSINGQQHVQVLVHQSDLMYFTQALWGPGFWFMERIGGYRYAGYMAAGEDSAFAYEK
jgi:hypothetical protein